MNPWLAESLCYDIKNTNRKKEFNFQESTTLHSVYTYCDKLFRNCSPLSGCVSTLNPISVPAKNDELNHSQSIGSLYH